MQPSSGFKETGASLKTAQAGTGSKISGQTDSSGTTSGNIGIDSLSVPVNDHYGLGHLGASLGNQAFHNVATMSLNQQHRFHDHAWDARAAADAARGGSQRFQQAFQDKLEKMQQQQQQQQQQQHTRSGSGLVFPNSVIGSLTAGQKIPHPMDLDASQQKVFRDNPELLKQFQQQAAQIPKTLPLQPKPAAASSATAAPRGNKAGGPDPVDQDASAVMRALGL